MDYSEDNDDLERFDEEPEEETDKPEVDTNVAADDDEEGFGLSESAYNQLIESENLTPEQRYATLTRKVQRIYSSVAGVDFTLAHDASPRLQMLSSHISQHLIFEGMTPKNIITGVEQELGKADFRLDIPEDCIVYDVIPLYTRNITKDSINYNPRTYVFLQYTNRDSPGHFDLIVLEDFFSMHQHFGFQYKDGKDLGKVSKGARLFKGDVLKESPSTTDNGDSMFGREMKTIMMTHRAVAEDGIGICEDVMEHFAFTVLEEGRVGFGKKTTVLNTYGNDQVYKFMPDIGEEIRDDHIFMATREIDEEVAIAMQNVKSTQNVDHIFDECFFVPGGGRVVSLDVICNNESENRIQDVEGQLKKYLDQTTAFYKKVLALEKKLKHDFGHGFRPSPALNALFFEALIGTNVNGTTKIAKQYRKAPMDDYTVKFVIARRMVPTYGFKFTDTRGRKGVCCAILPRDQMPVDKYGNSADIIVDPVSCVNRMIMGGPIESGINVITDIVTRAMRDALGINLNSSKLKHEIKVMADGHDPRFEKAWEHAVDYYKDIASESMYPKALTATQHDKAQVIQYAAKRPLGLYLPPEMNENLARSLNNLHIKHNTRYESVTFRGVNGDWITTKDPMSISDTYMILLDKIGDDKSASNSVRFQVFGVPATASKHDRYTSPTRIQNGKLHGESEARPFNSITRPSVQPEILDRNNNPKTAEICYRTQLRADNPSKIEKLIDRSIHPFGFTMPLQTLNHVTMCSGYKFVYKNDNPGLYTYSQMVFENSEENRYVIDADF
jgi:hypothetical protein